MRRFFLSAALVAAVGVAASVATAREASTTAPAARPATLFTKAFVYKGYSWQLIAVDGQAGKPDSLTIIATKHIGTATQTHTYSFGSGVTFSAASTLAAARLSAKLGRYGTIKASFKATGRLTTASPPKPCKGPKFQSRSGTLAGFSFMADTTFFHKTGKSAIAGQLSRQKGQGQLNCGGTSGGPTKPPTGGLALTAGVTSGDIVSIAVTKTAAGAVTQSVNVFEQQAKTAPATIFHSISTPASSSSFTVAADLSSATVHAAGPFLSGSLSFTASSTFGNNATGALAGNYTAKFDSIGPKSPAAAGGLQGVLSKS